MSRMADHTPPDDGQNTAEAPSRKVRGVDPLSSAHRRRLLAALNAAAAAGDVSAQAALVELSLAAERDEQIADALRRLRAGEAEDEG